MTERSKEVAEIILQQLGGNKFRAMTGATSLAHGETNEGIALSFRIGNNDKKVKAVRITLTPRDEYNIEFFGRMKDFVMPIIKKVDGIYADQLQEIFTRYTGMDTHL